MRNVCSPNVQPEFNTHNKQCASLLSSENHASPNLVILNLFHFYRRNTRSFVGCKNSTASYKKHLKAIGLSKKMHCHIPENRSVSLHFRKADIFGNVFQKDSNNVLWFHSKIFKCSTGLNILFCHVTVHSMSRTQELLSFQRKTKI